MKQIERGNGFDLQGCVLIIGDEPNFQNTVKRLIKNDKTIITASLKDAHETIASINYGILIIGHCTISFIFSLKLFLSVKKIKIIAIVDNQSEMIDMQKAGVFDLVHIEHIENMLEPAIRRAFYVYQLEKKIENLNSNAHLANVIFTKSSEMLSVLRKIENVAESELNVLIFGENGTGKAAIARKLHDQSHRATSPFIRVNCAYLSSNLIERELFGVSDSSFQLPNGEVNKITSADGGTLFLDGINELSTNLQNKILEFNKKRFINNENHMLNIRIISSMQLGYSNKNVDKILTTEFYRQLGEIEIVLPPLRERKDDILLFANRFLQQFNRMYQRNIKGFSDEVRKILLSYNWPGNIRELENMIKSAVILADSALIHSSDLMLKKDEKKEKYKILNLRQIREKTEKQVILQALTKVKGNVSQAANLLGVSRPTLYTLLDKYELDKSRV